MKIKKFTKLKNGMYKVILEDRKFKIHEDLILKHNLLLTKEVTDKDIENLEQENIKYEVYEIALKELRKRLRSKKELEELLLRKGISPKVTKECINILTDQGYLNDEIYAESYTHDKMLLTSDGPKKIEKELVDNGIEQEFITKALINYTEEKEREKIIKIINRYQKSNKKSKNAFKLKMKQYLISNLGYHTYLVEELLSNVDIDDNDIYKQEYDKLYRKLSKKYEGKLLEYKIKEKLYQKGFRNH